MKQKCGDCAKYIQHFAILNGKVQRIWCGHCMEQKNKKLDQDSTACTHFVPGEPVEKTLVSKEYLTKSLLQKVLSMELWKNSP